MHAHDYVARTGLALSPTAMKDAQATFAKLLDAASLASARVKANSLYEYTVPKLSVDGICSLRGAFEPKPYDLTGVLGGRNPVTTARLQLLDALVAQVQSALNIEWLGFYQARRIKDPALIKLAYRGLPSRAEFPLTQAFAAKSNNTAVAMSGKARLINDVVAHLSKGGAYYECDPNVQAEACLPLFEGEEVVGIVDAEHSAKNTFTPERLALLVALCLELPALLPAGGINARRA